jgi:uncharacterized protein (TIGR02186 family)
MRAPFAIVALLIAFTGSAHAERLVTSISNPSISITSSFAGEALTLFGTIEPDPGQELEGSYHVVVTVSGPANDRVVRLKTNPFGIWINTEGATFERLPSFFQVLATGRLDMITDAATIFAEALTPEARVAMAAAPDDAPRFGYELVRLMSEQGLFGINEQGVSFLSNSLYSARLQLPSDVPNGAFLATTYVFKDGAIVARRAERFTVRKSGFERFLGDAARQLPLLYGLTCVALALSTGWLGGVIFKR